MADELTIAGKAYVSSRRAAQMSGYAQDYIGQLARSAQIDAERIGGLWYISIDSLNAYREKAEAYVPEPPESMNKNDTESLITFEGKDYISAGRASDITGYNPDYVGQLARSGKISSRQIGNRWYVDRAALLAHKEEKDKLLAAVQRDAVGIARSVTTPMQSQARPDYEPALTYSRDERDLLPPMFASDPIDLKPKLTEIKRIVASTPENEVARKPVAIRSATAQKVGVRATPRKSRIPRKSIFYGTAAGGALTLVAILVFVTLSTPKEDSPIAASSATTSVNTASASNALQRIGDILEPFVTSELQYTRHIQ